MRVGRVLRYLKSLRRLLQLRHLRRRIQRRVSEQMPRFVQLAQHVLVRGVLRHAQLVLQLLWLFGVQRRLQRCVPEQVLKLCLDIFFIFFNMLGSQLVRVGRVLRYCESVR